LSSNGTVTLGSGVLVKGAAIGANWTVTITFGEDVISATRLVHEPTVLTLYRETAGTLRSRSTETTLCTTSRKRYDAIAYGLGQSVYVDDTDKFCVIAGGADGTSESVPSTMVIRSAVAGKSGELYFAGDEELLKALGLSTIQESRENRFGVSVYDAHSGKLIKGSQVIVGNVIYGAVTDAVDVKFDAMANVSASWNESAKRYDLTRESGTYTTTVHLADNSATLQIGANEGEDLTLGLGDMSASALGLDGLLVISRELAAEAVTRIDGAINKVSTMRARLGAYQNRLEHTIANLTAASTNTAAAESRIRDADMAKEMINFTRLNILSQAGNSMLGQANQLPRNVLMLLR
jgi:flagellin